MTCPFCKREFPFDNGSLDKDIAVIGQRIAEINSELSRIKASSPSVKRSYEGRKKVLVLELNDLVSRMSQLKAVRKASDQQIKSFEYQAFKNIVKERYGESEYKKILSLVEEEVKAYKISGLMRHEYTRSPHKANVTSISKL